MPPVPETELVFVISATAMLSDRNFMKMKDVIKNIITRYGQGQIRYSIITHGTVPRIEVGYIWVCGGRIRKRNT